MLLGQHRRSFLLNQMGQKLEITKNIMQRMSELGTLSPEKALSLKSLPSWLREL